MKLHEMANVAALHDGMFTGTTDKSSPVGSVKDGQVVPLLPILPGFKEM
jgi:hypothetical protein